jgi:hypothetical protein
MIIRRIATAFRKQDWATVTVEFTIVVTGIFVGLQVDSWNTERTDRIREKVILEQLHSDFAANAANISRYVSRHDQMVEDLAFALNVLTRGELTKTDVGRFRNAFVSMYQLPSISASMGGYDSVIATGDLALITDQELKSRLIQLSSELDAEINLTSYFRDLNQINMELTRDVVLLVPNKDRTDTTLKVDFDVVKNDYRMLTVVADQHRKHQIIGAARRSLANNFSEAKAYVETLMKQPDSSDSPP